MRVTASYIESLEFNLGIRVERYRFLDVDRAPNEVLFLSKSMVSRKEAGDTTRRDTMFVDQMIRKLLQAEDVVRHRACIIKERLYHFFLFATVQALDSQAGVRVSHSRGGPHQCWCGGRLLSYQFYPVVIELQFGP